MALAGCETAARSFAYVPSLSLATLTSIASLWASSVALAQTCPEVPYPPGVDLPASRVSALLVTDASGRVVEASDWTGPAALVEATQTTLGNCALPPATIARHTWTFEPPAVNVSGRLREGATRVPVARVQVQVGDRTTQTDADGRFELRNVAPGTLQVRVVDPRWRLLGRSQLTLPAEEHVQLDLRVATAGAVADELVGRYRPRVPSATVRRVPLSQAEGIPGTLGDPLRLLAAQPGLSRTPYDAGWLLVRGGDFDDTGLYLDGVRVPLIYHLGGFTSVLHPQMVEAVDFWPGLFPARFGGATSGAVDVVPGPVGERARATGGVNLVFAHAFAEAPTPLGGIAVAARRSYLDGILSLVVGPEGARIAPRFWDVQARASVGRGSVTVLALSDSIDAPSYGSPGEVLQITQRAAQIQARLPLSPRVDLRTWLAWTRRDVVGDDSPQTVAETYPGFRLDGFVPLPAQGRLWAGLEAQRRTFRIERDGQLRSGPLWTADPYAGMSVGTRVVAFTDVRLETLLTPGQRPRVAPSPRAGLRVAPTPDVEVRAELGQVHQPPPATLLLGLADGAYLPLERSEQLTAGASLRRGGLQLQLDVFTRVGSDLGGIEFDGSVGQGTARAWGVESAASLTVGPTQATAIYQWLHAERAEDQARARTQGVGWLPWTFEQPHRLDLRLSHRLPRQVILGARFRTSSGFPRQPDGVGGLEPEEAYDILLQRTTDLGLQPDATRLAPFHSLDVRIARTFTFRTWRLSAGLDVQNLTNRRVAEPVITGFGEARPSYGFGLPILPIFNLEGEFWLPGE
ncbi:MAG: TonB-dependent receptor [Myxococcales bacterium]|nr:TonB-dependent receptor [Myxococcales bacterium]